jgi:hypothetical protein
VVVTDALPATQQSLNKYMVHNPEVRGAGVGTGFYDIFYSYLGNPEILNLNKSH